KHQSFSFITFGLMFFYLIYDIFYNKPFAVPSSLTSIFKAAGCFGHPGIVIISPVNATIKPAPVFVNISRIVISNSVGAPNFVGSSVNEYCVLATHTGYLSQPFSFIVFNCL